MLAYWRERFPLQLFLPIALVLAVPGHIGHPFAIGDFLFDVAVAIVLLAQFRLWDDLADLESDATLHPDRVLVRSPRKSAFAVAGGVLGACALAAVGSRDGAIPGVSLLAALSVALAFVYRRPHSRSLPGELIRLAKYPAFIFIIGAGELPRSVEVLTAAALLTFLAACAYEAWHDPGTPLRALIRSS